MILNQCNTWMWISTSYIKIEAIYWTCISLLWQSTQFTVVWFQREQSKGLHIRHNGSVLFSYYLSARANEIGSYPYFQMPLGVCKLFVVHAPLITTTVMCSVIEINFTLMEATLIYICGVTITILSNWGLSAFSKMANFVIMFSLLFVKWDQIVLFKCILKVFRYDVIIMIITDH